MKCVAYLCQPFESANEEFLTFFEMKEEICAKNASDITGQLEQLAASSYFPIKMR